jgi:hypothetical protein
MIMIVRHDRVKYSMGKLWGESKIAERQRERGGRQSVAANE